MGSDAKAEPGILPIDEQIEALVADPLVRLVMAADRVDPVEFRDLLLKAANRGSPMARPAIDAVADDVTLTPDASGAYRPAIGIALFNARGEVFVAHRIDRAEDGWQMPQGGVEPGETPRDAALRELREEIGTDSVEVIAESRGWLRYDLPPQLLGRAWGGRWRGQQQKWFAMRLRGPDTMIDLATEHPEFSAWRWAPAAWVPDLIVGFKRQLYRDVLREFAPIAAGMNAPAPIAPTTDTTAPSR